MTKPVDSSLLQRLLRAAVDSEPARPGPFTPKNSSSPTPLNSVEFPRINRRSFISSALSLGVAGAVGLHSASSWALGEAEKFHMAQLNYDPASYDPRPGALRRLLLEVEKRTSVEVSPAPPTVTGLDADLYSSPFLLMAGDRRFEPFPEELVANLRMFLQGGGTLLIDSAEGLTQGPFIDCVKRELNRILPTQSLAPVPKDHVVYKSFYLVDEPVGRIQIAPTFDAIADQDRLSVMLSYNDLLGAWARDSFGNWMYEMTSGGQRQREMAYRMGINLVMYALCINYKADQVHIPFILKRRKWRVD